MICCFFGHSYTPETVKPLLKNEIVKLLEEYAEVQFYVGNHGNFDAMVISVLKSLKSEYSNFTFNVVLAYMPGKKDEFAVGDPYEDTIYPEGLEMVPRRFAISARNKWMVEKTDMVICYKTWDGGGAAQFIRMAERKGKKIINLADM